MQVTVDLVTATCPSCQMVHAFPRALYDRAQEAKPNYTLYCPAGHAWHYRGESDADREKRLRQRAEQQIAQARDEARDAQAARERAERALKRHKKRSAAGTCPCCQRTFANMAQHMKTQHPEFVKTSGANVVALKKPSQT